MTSIIPNDDCITVILSAELDWRDDDRNREAHIELKARLARQYEIGELLSIQDCRGCYKGVPERSIAITGKAGRVLAIGQSEGEHFHQESILVVNNWGGGSLRYIDREHGAEDEPIGRYTELEDAGATEAWTEVLATGHIFTFT